MGVPTPSKKRVRCPRCFFYFAHFWSIIALLDSFVRAAGIALQRKCFFCNKNSEKHEKIKKNCKIGDVTPVAWQWVTPVDSRKMGPSRLKCLRELMLFRKLMLFSPKWSGPAGTPPWHQSGTPRKTVAALRAELSLAHSLRTVAGLVDPACERRARPQRRVMILILIRGTPINGESQVKV